MVYRYTLLYLLLFSGIAAFSQRSRDEALAESYLIQGEFDKAATLYLELWEKNNHPDEYYRQLFQCYQKQSLWDPLIKVIRRQIRYQEESPLYVADLIYAYSLSGQTEDQKAVAEKWLKSLPKKEAYLVQAGLRLENYKLFELANQLYEKGQLLLNDRKLFVWEMAVNQLRLGNSAIGCNLLTTYLDENPSKTQQIRNLLQDGPPAWMEEMERQLYPKIQREAKDPIFSEFLIWIFVQRKDFASALTQAKALDRRYGEQGMRIMEIGYLAKEENRFAEAAQAFDLVVKKGIGNPYFQTARIEQLNCRKEQIAREIAPSMADLLLLKSDYSQFIEETGKNAQNAHTLREFADLIGFYLQQTDSAVILCEEILRMPGLSRENRNKTKLSLGDFYLMSEDPWNATLLYSQVDKEEQDSELGEEARYKNAFLSYVQGDFEWAQTQLQVLKSSTSELISNDAIQLSVFILDNSGLDTIFTPLAMYARAELLLFQKKEDEALSILDSIRFLYPAHVLWDDMNYLEAGIRIRRSQYQQALPLLEDILKNYKEDLRGDDAAFLLGEIYERYLPDKEKAKQYYQQILDEYPGSLLIIDARKRFRILRGDQLPE